MNDIERGATAQAQQQHFHRTRPEVSPARFRRAVEDQAVSAARFGKKSYILDPFNAGFHDRLLVIRDGAGGPLIRAGIFPER